LFDVRLQTFVLYPKTLISSRDMASAGFYYTGEDRVLKCFGCKLTVTRFREGDSPFVTGHRSGCSFVRVTKKTEKPVAAAAAAAAAVEHSLSPLGESYYVNYSLIGLALALVLLGLELLGLLHLSLVGLGLRDRAIGRLSLSPRRKP